MWEIAKSNSEGRAFFIITCILAAVAVGFFALRLYSRRLSKTTLDASDYCCLLAVILNIGLVVIIFGVFSHGWGEDISQFTVDDGYFAAIVFITLEIVWYAASVAVRASMLLLYIRMFPSRQFKISCWFLIGLFCIILLTIILASFLICRPLSYSFVPTTPGGHCGDLAAFQLYTATTSMLSDIIVVFLPMPILWKLQLAISKKLGLIAIFGVGFLICILTFIRILISRYYMVDNYTKQSAVVGLITALEPILGVINACLPFMPRIFTHLSTISRSAVANSSSEHLRLKVFRANSRNSEKSSGCSSDGMSPISSHYFTTTHNQPADNSNMV